MGIDIIKNWRDFYPRPLRGGRHLDTKRHGQSTAYFYPRPLRGGRLVADRHLARGRDISIHALCEEGDLLSMGIVPGMCLFLSTPSARRATFLLLMVLTSFMVFLSTPSARRATGMAFPPFCRSGISIHALCEEGDSWYIRPHVAVSGFLSTPSARRATKVKVTSGYRCVFLSTPSARRATEQ